MPPPPTTPASPGPAAAGAPARPAALRDLVRPRATPVGAPRFQLIDAFEYRAWRRKRERSRRWIGIGFSLLVHALLLKVTFFGQDFPGAMLKWPDRRETEDIRVAILPPKVPIPVPAPEPAQVRAPEPRQRASQPRVAIPAPLPKPAAAAASPQLAAVPTPQVEPTPVAVETPPVARVAVPLELPKSAPRPSETAPTLESAPAVTAMTTVEKSAWVVPVPPAMPTPAPEQVAQPRLADAQQLVAAEAARVEAARAEAARIEAARIEAARIEAARIEAARIEAARAEAARIEAEKAEATRVVAVPSEIATSPTEAAAQAQRLEGDPQEIVRAEMARVAAARAEAARAEAARAEAAKAEAAKGEAARIAAEETARREAVLRNLGRQLEAEADRRDALASARREREGIAARMPPPPVGYTSPRRYRLFGRSDPNEALIKYVEAWSRKIELNMPAEFRETAKRKHVNPVVTVALRSDGSVESVAFVTSSGDPTIDEAIRRLVQDQSPYQVFPPGLALQYDVIEVRRTWAFDVGIRLY